MTILLVSPYRVILACGLRDMGAWRCHDYGLVVGTGLEHVGWGETGLLIDIKR